MSDLISRQDAIDAVTRAIWHYPNESYKNLNVYEVTEALVSDAIKSLPSAEPQTVFIDGVGHFPKISATLQNLTKPNKTIAKLPAAEPTLRERALMLLLNWAVECGFGYDNFPEEYERYKDEIEDMSYFDGMIYIAEKEVGWNG